MRKTSQPFFGARERALARKAVRKAVPPFVSTARICERQSSAPASCGAPAWGMSHFRKRLLPQARTSSRFFDNFGPQVTELGRLPRSHRQESRASMPLGRPVHVHSAYQI